MDEKIKTQALAIIQQRKRAAQKEFEAQMTPLWQDAQYVALSKQRTKALIEFARAKAYKEENLEKIAENFKNFDEKCEKIEKKHQLFGKKPNYSCKFCNDEGYVDGKMCQCLKREISNLLLQKSGFSSLESFEESIPTAGDLEPLYRLMQKWCASQFSKNLVLIAGQPGVGKSHLTRCMARDLIERGKVVKIVTAFAMNQKFCEIRHSQMGELANEFLNPEVLFIDDLGSEPLYQNVTEEFLYLIINERKMRKLATVITSNLTLDDIQNRYNERIFSRIVDRETSITLYIEGEDRRIKPKK